MSLSTSYWLCAEWCSGLAVPLSLQWAHIMSHHAKCFDTATQRALPIWCQSPQVLVSPRWRLSERARTKSPQQPRTMQPDWQRKGQNGASLSSGCLSGGRKRKKDSGTGACTGSTEKTIGGKQDAVCLEVARLTVKQKATLNICVAFPWTEQLGGITWFKLITALTHATHYTWLPISAFHRHINAQ